MRRLAPSPRLYNIATGEHAMSTISKRFVAKQILACGCVSVALFCGVGCAPKVVPRMTVEDLIEDRVTLDGVLMKCNEHPSAARTSTDCENARIAVERLAKDVDPTEEVKRKAEFEAHREKLRLAQDELRRQNDAQSRVDPYALPVVPVDAPPQ